MKKYSIRNKHGKEEFQVVEDDLTYSLYYADNECWHDDVRGKFILSVSDNGNQYTWRGSKKISDQWEASCVALLLRFVDNEKLFIYEETLTNL